MNEIQKLLIGGFVELLSTNTDLRFLFCVAFCYVLLHLVNILQLEWWGLHWHVSPPRYGHLVGRVDYPSHRNHLYHIASNFPVLKN